MYRNAYSRAIDTGGVSRKAFIACTHDPRGGGDGRKNFLSCRRVKEVCTRGWGGISTASEGPLYQLRERRAGAEVKKRPGQLLLRTDVHFRNSRGGGLQEGLV